jgi:hypothetical protein
MRGLTDSEFAQLQGLLQKVRKNLTGAES